MGLPMAAGWARCGPTRRGEVTARATTISLDLPTSCACCAQDISEGEELGLGWGWTLWVPARAPSGE